LTPGAGVDDGALRVERHDFHEPADADHDGDQHAHETDAFFDSGMIHK